MATIDASPLETTRKARGLSQRALAETAGVTRQAVGAVESGRMQPSVGIALALARALGASVEELFGEPRVPARPQRVAVATIAGRSVAHPLLDAHLATEPAQTVGRTAFLAGCELSAGLLARHTTARAHDLHVVWLSMTNREALAALARNDVHAAVVHGHTNPFQRKSQHVLACFDIAGTEEGWLVRPGNPLSIRRAADLLRKNVRLANRPGGAGARDLLDELLVHAHVDPRHIAGYAREVPGQLDAGRAVAYDFADAAIGTASVARTCGLTFVPLRTERCSLVVPRTTMRTPEIRTIVDALRSTPYRRELEALDAYDVTTIGELIA